MEEVAHSLEDFRLQVHLYKKRVANTQIVQLRIKAAQKSLGAMEKRALEHAEALMAKRVIDFEQVFDTLDLAL